ncbi:MAG: Carbohydrate kinase [Verrucomicrobiota bacterium]|nr:Carbohydrate kinase [Verrucomicrobiota bacterium]
MSDPANRRRALAELLRGPRQPLPSAVLGFDGFVDEMIQVVGERRSLDDFSPVAAISDFGALISRAAGHSSLREIVVTAVHCGGCAINMGDGLAALGVPVDAFATLGEPAHPSFQPVTARFRSVRSWGREPGRTLAFEFQDGKLMFSSVAQLADFTPERVAGLLADGAYAAACTSAGLIALTDWTLYPHMTAVWQLLQREVYARLTHRPAFFLDLVDPSGRTPADLRGMLDTLTGFGAAGPVTLGLNGNEANVLARLLTLPACTEAAPDSSLALAAALRGRLGLSEVVIHHIRSAAVSGPAGEASLWGPYCAQPRKSTGAGDRFNAGYALGVLLGLPAADRLACACGASGYFVRAARSARLGELAEFLGHGDWPDAAGT